MKKKSETILFGLCSILTGLLCAFSFPNIIQKELDVYTSFFIWFAYIPLIFVLFKNTNTKQVFFFSFCAGLVFYLTGIYWFVLIPPLKFFAVPAWIAFSAFMALYMAAGFTLSKFLNRKFNLSYLFSLPILCTIFEFIREWLFSGNSLLTPAQSQFKFLFLLQLLKFTGVYGIVFIVISVNILPVMLVYRKTIKILKRENIIWLTLFCFLIILTIAANFNKEGTKAVNVGVLQPNVDMTRKWDREFREELLGIMKTQVEEVKREKPILIVWPESGFPGILQNMPGLVKQIADWTADTGTYHIIQSDELEQVNGSRNVYNTAFLISPSGSITGKYRKYHLVPFGEYIPFQSVLKFLAPLVGRHGFVSAKPGKEIVPLHLENFTIGVVICYDGIFPEISREFCRKGAAFLVQLSYERWYGNSSASAHILTNTLLRAVENNVYLVRSVEAGISAIISPTGKIIKNTGLYKRASLAGTVHLKEPGAITFYTRFGDVFIYGIAGILLMVILLMGWKKVRQRQTE